jgi:hypothetical protein
MVDQMRPGRDHQDPETEQDAEGDQPVGDGDSLAWGVAYWRPITHALSIHALLEQARHHAFVPTRLMTPIRRCCSAQ